MLKTLLFDIDGTLLLTGGVGKHAFERVFSELFGVEGAWKGLVPDGKTDPLIIEELIKTNLSQPISAKERDALTHRYQEYFDQHIDDFPGFHLMPGIQSLLDRLHTSGDYLIGLETGNFEQVAWSKVRRGGLRSYFSFGGFGSDSADRAHILEIAIQRAQKKHALEIDPKQIVVIGDAPQDIQAAKQFGVRCIAVATGRRDKAELQAFGPDIVLDDLSDYDQFIRAIHA